MARSSHIKSLIFIIKNIHTMRALTCILESVQRKQSLSLIDTKDKFLDYVNEQLSSEQGYSYESAICIGSNIFEESTTISEAIQKFDNFVTTQ